MICDICQEEIGDVAVYCSNPGCMQCGHESCMYYDSDLNRVFCSVECLEDAWNSLLSPSKVWDGNTLKEFMEIREQMAESVAEAEKFFNEPHAPTCFASQKQEEWQLSRSLDNGRGQC